MLNIASRILSSTPTRLHFIITDSSICPSPCPDFKVPSNMREIVPDLIGTNGLFI
jgi:hypothetical protein